MVRNFTQFRTSIWRDNDFIRLTRQEQGTHFFFASQPEISAVGVLPLTLARWSTRAADATVETLTADIRKMQRYEFALADRDTEELLVRSFVRADQGYRNEKRRPVIQAAARAVESPRLRRALVVEFARLALPVRWIPGYEAVDNPGDGNVDSLSRQEIEDWLSSLENRASRGTSRFDRVVVANGEREEPSTLNPQPPPPRPRVAEAAGAERARPEGEESLRDWRERVVVATLKVRPEWGASSIDRALKHKAVRERGDRALIEAAMALVAADPETDLPGRLTKDGPWWAQAQRQLRGRHGATTGRKPVQMPAHPWNPGPDGLCLRPGGEECPLPQGHEAHRQKPENK